VERIEFPATIGGNEATVTADVSVGRAPPPACSDATLQDCGDPCEVELIRVEVETFDSEADWEPSGKACCLHLLSAEERRKLEAEALDRAIDSRNS
jgi:hypothetical protein